MRCHWHHMHDACVVIDTACMVHVVSLTPHAWCMQCHWHRMHGACGVNDSACTKFFWTTSKSENHMQHSGGMQKKFKMHELSMTLHARCMRCLWYRMHNACGVIDTTCTYACGVIDTAWTLHAVSMTPHAHACGIIDTACMVYAVSLTLHAKYDTACTIDKQFKRPWQPSKGISIKNSFYPSHIFYNSTDRAIRSVPVPVVLHYRTAEAMFSPLPKNSLTRVKKGA
jgi:hypothetical protein